MKRRRWSADDMAKLQSMARKYPAAQIAAELGRGIAGTITKAHEPNFRKGAVPVHPNERPSSHASWGTARQ